MYVNYFEDLKIRYYINNKKDLNFIFYFHVSCYAATLREHAYNGRDGDGQLGRGFFLTSIVHLNRSSQTYISCCRRLAAVPL